MRMNNQLHLGKKKIFFSTNLNTYLLVVIDPVSQRVPLVRVIVEVLHGRGQRGLERVALVAEEPHDDGPDERGKDRIGLRRCLELCLFCAHGGEAYEDAREEVEDNLGRGQRITTTLPFPRTW